MKNEHKGFWSIPILSILWISMIGWSLPLKSQMTSRYNMLWDQVQSQRIDLKKCDSSTTSFLQTASGSFDVILNKRGNRKFFNREIGHGIVDADLMVVMLCLSEFGEPRLVRILSIHPIAYASKSYLLNEEKIGRRIREAQGFGIWGVSSFEKFWQYHEDRKSNPCIAGTSHPNICMTIEISRDGASDVSLHDVSIYYE